MNRYVAQGMLADAKAGKRVVFVGDSGKYAREAFLRTVATLNQRDDAIQSVHRSNGRERVECFSGGSIRFISRRGNGARGLEADVVFIDCSEMQRETIREIAPMVAASAGELICL